MFEESGYEIGEMTADEAFESVLKRPELYGLCRVEERDSAIARLAHLREWIEENRPLRCSIDYGEEGDLQDDATVILSILDRVPSE